MVYKRKTLYHAHLQLAAKFYLGLFLAPYNGSYMWLVDVDYPVIYPLGPGAVHVLLLVVNGVQHHQILLFFGLQWKHFVSR